MAHTNRSLDEKIEQVKEYCKRFNEERTKYYSGVYMTGYGSNKDGKIESWTSCAHSGLTFAGVFTREEIIKLFIDYFGFLVSEL